MLGMRKTCARHLSVPRALSTLSPPFPKTCLSLVCNFKTPPNPLSWRSRAMLSCVAVKMKRPYVNSATAMSDVTALCVCDVNAYDAGTDTGPTFTSEDMPQDKRAPIFSFGGVHPADASIFYNPTEHTILPVGNIALELINCS